MVGDLILNKLVIAVCDGRWFNTEQVNDSCMDGPAIIYWIEIRWFKTEQVNDSSMDGRWFNTEQVNDSCMDGPARVYWIEIMWFNWLFLHLSNVSEQIMSFSLLAYYYWEKQPLVQYDDSVFCLNQVFCL